MGCKESNKKKNKIFVLFSFEWPFFTDFTVISVLLITEVDKGLGERKLANNVVRIWHESFDP